tara:strand:+ start:30719 stop:31906 length:1188 start_codon:yes stop_codon:yes gene_type:complete
MKKKYISVLIQTNSLAFKYGGGSTGLVSICNAFARNKSIKTTLLSFENELSQKDIKILNKQLEEIKNIYLREFKLRIPTLSSFLKLLKEISRNDLIYIHSMSSVFSIITFLFSKIFCKKTIFRFHGSLMKVYTKKFSLIKHFFTFIQLCLYKSADMFILSSEIEFNELKEYDFLNLLDKNKIRIIYESVEKNFQIKKKIKEFNLRNIDFLYVGRINKEKGIFEFLDFLNKSLENNDFEIKKSLKVIIAGPLDICFEKLFEKQITELQKRKNIEIKFKGFISNKERNELYNDSKFFLYPTYGDCFGLSVVEALYYGCKVISTKNLGIYKSLLDLDLIYIYQREYKKDKKLINQIFSEKISNNIPKLEEKLNIYFGFDAYTENYQHIINSFFDAKNN